jgi:pentatricopeptide repeat protein
MGFRGGGRGRGGGGRRGGGRNSSGSSSLTSSRVIEVNKRIKAHGDARQIDQALAAFASLDEQGLQPTAVSFNVILFALVKCGELQQATMIYQRMLTRTDVKPNVVTLTSLLKGHCGAGDMQSACMLLDSMAQNGSQQLRPNTRTLNTFLRGCLWTGEVGRAMDVFGRLCGGGGSDVCPDATSIDYLLRLLTTSLRLDEAQTMFEEHAAVIDRTPFPLFAFATACALRSEAKAARRWLDQAAVMLSDGGDGDDGDSKAAFGGASVGSAASTPGIANFMAHQRAELHENIDRIRLALDDAPQKPPPRKRQKHSQEAPQLPLPLQDALCRTLLFSSTGRVGHHGEAGEDRASMAKGLTARLESLGLPRCSHTPAAAPDATAGAAATTVARQMGNDGAQAGAVAEQGSAQYTGKHFGVFGVPEGRGFLNGTTCCGCYCEGGAAAAFPCRKRCCRW